MKRPTPKEMKEKWLGELNSFMKNHDIPEITFGKTHSIKKTEGELAEDIVKPNRKKK